jgi:hypothetical protein
MLLHLNTGIRLVECRAMSAPLPFLNAALANLEQGMRIGAFDVGHGGEMLLIPFLKFPLQMPEFETELPVCYGNPAHVAGAPQFALIERESPPNRLQPDRFEITADAADGRSLRGEPFELRMMTIPPGSSLENLLGEEPFPPECDEPD